jgi:hypothetical protein
MLNAFTMRGDYRAPVELKRCSAARVMSGSPNRQLDAVFRLAGYLASRSSGRANGFR